MGGATRTFPDGSVVLLTLLMLALAIVNLGATDAKAVAEGSLGASLEALALGLHMGYEIAVVLCLGRVLGKGHDREATVLGFAYRSTPGRVISRNPHGFLGCWRTAKNSVLAATEPARARAVAATAR
jgi:hypothetical protein